MSQTETTVYVSRNGQNSRHYHVDTTCFNLPENNREIALSKVKPMYDPCGMCVDGAEGDSLVRPYFECVKCGNQKKGHTTGCRTLMACPECGEMTTHESV